MSVVINTNSAATIASNNLSASNAMLQKSLNRLSSGSKIVNASDDAGGVAVAGRLGAASKRVGVITQNIGNAVSFLQHQDNALKTLSKMLERMSELQSLNSDSTKSNADRELYNTEFQKLAVAIKDVVDNTDFNGNDVFGALSVKVNDDAGTSYASATMASSLSAMSAAGTQPYIAAGTFSDVTTTTVASTTATTVRTTVINGTTNVRAAISDNANAASSTGAAAAVTGAVSAATIATDIQTIASLRAQNGAAQSTLGYYAEINSSAKATFESAISKIVDVDVAEESTQLARWNTLVQAGTAMIAQANGSTQSALTLLRG
jgi:flagellin